MMRQENITNVLLNIRRKDYKKNGIFTMKEQKMEMVFVTVPREYDSSTKVQDSSEIIFNFSNYLFIP